MSLVNYVAELFDQIFVKLPAVCLLKFASNFKLRSFNSIKLRLAMVGLLSFRMRRRTFLMLYIVIYIGGKSSLPQLPQLFVASQTATNVPSISPSSAFPITILGRFH